MKYFKIKALILLSSYLGLVRSSSTNMLLDLESFTTNFTDDCSTLNSNDFVTLGTQTK